MILIIIFISDLYQTSYHQNQSHHSQFHHPNDYHNRREFQQFSPWLVLPLGEALQIGYFFQWKFVWFRYLEAWILYILLDIQWKNIQHFAVANISSCHAEFKPMQWTQKPWNLTHLACVQNRIQKEYFLSWKSEVIYSKCVKKHSWPHPINFHPTFLLAPCRWSSPWGLDSFSQLHRRSTGECREWNGGFGWSHCLKIFVEIKKLYIPLYYEISDI